MKPRLTVQLMGHVSFLIDDKPIKQLNLTTAQAVVLLVLLADGPVSREWLTNTVVYSTDPNQASANLRSLLTGIRRGLGDFIEITRKTVGRRADADIWIDSAELSTLLAQPEPTYAELVRATALYKGDFLYGFNLRGSEEFERWLLLERERLRLFAITAFQQLAQKQEQLGQFTDALNNHDRLLSIEPLLEENQRKRMLLLTRLGQRGQALQHFSAIQTLFEEELGEVPEPATVTLYERIQRTASTPPLHLPQARNEFVGRSADLSLLLPIVLHPARRLLTLLGSGGMGKTRLAQAVAHQLYTTAKGAFLEGIHFVNLVAAVTVTDVAVQIANILDIPLRSQQPATEQVIAQLAEQELLLIFDNFEQLVESSAEFVTTLLNRCPHLKLLITSRERLNLYEETVFDVAGLTLPQENDPHSLTADAAQLFINTAQRHKMDYALMVDEFPLLVQLCHKLEGVPLAIELAAGLIRNYAIAEITQKINRSLDFLESSLRNVPSRQRSLRAVFLHSWALLSAELQTKFTALTIFPTDFDKIAAAAIVGVSSAELTALTDKSLLQQTVAGRFTIHPLLRQFTVEQLDVAEQRNHLDRHAAYYAHFINERTTSHRPTYLQSFPELSAENDNLLLAWNTILDRLLTSDDAAPWQWIEQIRRPLISYFFKKNWFYNCQQHYKSAREAFELAGWDEEPQTSQRRLFHAQIALTDLNCRWILGSSAGVLEHVYALLPVLRNSTADKDTANALNILVQLNLSSGDSNLVPELLAELKQVSERIDEPAYHSIHLIGRVYYADRLGNFEQALTLNQQVIQVLAPLEDNFYEARMLESLGRRLQKLQRYDESIAIFEQGIHLAKRADLSLQLAIVQVGLGRLYLELERFEAALNLFVESQLILEVHNEQRVLAEIEHLQATIFLRRVQAGETELRKQMLRLLRSSVRRAKRDDLFWQVLMSGVDYARYLFTCGQQELAFLLVVFAQKSEHLSSLNRNNVQIVLDTMREEGQFSAETIHRIEKQSQHTTINEITAIILSPA